jgi:hypothetical protein
MFSHLEDLLEQIQQASQADVAHTPAPIGRALMVELKRLLRSQTHPHSRHEQLLLDLQRLCACQAHGQALDRLREAMGQQLAVPWPGGRGPTGVAVASDPSAL